MIRLIIERMKLPTLLSSINKSKDALTSIVKRNFAEVKKPAQSQNSSLAKDVIVYQYENPRKFRLLNFFVCSQFVFWGYLGQWTYTGMKYTEIDQSKINDDTPWYKKINMGEAKYKNALASACFIIGYLVFFCGWTFTLRSVRYLVLKKDGQTVAFITYTPFGGSRNMNVPLRCISAQETRASARNFLPLKVQNRHLYYILDMGGEFKNTKIFDTVIGLQRKLK